VEIEDEAMELGSVGQMGHNSGWVTWVIGRSALTHNPLQFLEMSYFAPTLDKFKQCLKTHLFIQSYYS